MSDDLPDRKTLMIFGLNYGNLECFRESMLTGFVGAGVGAVAVLFYTSRIKPTTQSAFASFWIAATCTWVSCRYKKSIKRQELEHMKENLFGRKPVHVEPSSSEDKLKK